MAGRPGVGKDETSAPGLAIIPNSDKPLRFKEQGLIQFKLPTFFYSWHLLGRTTRVSSRKNTPRVWFELPDENCEALVSCKKHGAGLRKYNAARRIFGAGRRK